MFAPGAEGVCRNRPVTIIEARIGIAGAEHQVRTADDTTPLTRWNDVKHVHRRMPTRQRRDVPRLNYREDSNPDEDEDDNNDDDASHIDSDELDALCASAAFGVGDAVLANGGRKPPTTRRGVVDQYHVNPGDPRNTPDNERTYIYIVKMGNDPIGAFQAHQLTLQDRGPHHTSKRHEHEPRAAPTQRTANRRSTRKPTTMPK